MKESVFRPLMERVESIEKNYGSFVDWVISTTYLDEEHRMKMEDELFSTFAELEKVYQELSGLELADLLDFKKSESEEYGKFG